MGPSHARAAASRAEGASTRARVPPMDYADKLPPSPWYIFAPPPRYIFPPPLTKAGKSPTATATRRCRASSLAPRAGAGHATSSNSTSGCGELTCRRPSRALGCGMTRTRPLPDSPPASRMHPKTTTERRSPSFCDLAKSRLEASVTRQRAIVRASPCASGRRVGAETFRATLGWSLPSVGTHLGHTRVWSMNRYALLGANHTQATAGQVTPSSASTLSGTLAQDANNNAAAQCQLKESS